MNYAVLLLILCALVSARSTAAEQEYTWSRDVAKIVYSKCTPCHREGEIAPMPLTTYQEVRDVALSIKHEVEDRHMPPWPPEHGIGSFLGVRSLTDNEYNTLIAWIDQGAAPGDLSQAPPPPTFPSGSQLGTPDLVLRMDAKWRIEGNNKDVYRYFVLPTELTQDRDIAAIEFRPDNASVVHHVLYFVDTTGTARRRDAEDPLLGYAGFGDPGQRREEQVEHGGLRGRRLRGAGWRGPSPGRAGPGCRCAGTRRASAPSRRPGRRRRWWGRPWRR